MLRAAAFAIGMLAASPAAAQNRGAFDVVSHDLQLAIDPERQTVSGHQTIRLRLGPGVREASFTDNALEIVESSAPVRRAAGRMVFTLPETDGTATLRIVYRGKPRRGLNFEPGLVYTSYFACDWMVCDQDRPGDRARLNLRLHLPAAYRQIDRGPATRDHPAFLYGFAAGKLSEARLGGALRAYSATRTPAELKALFGSTADMVAFLEAKAGVALPSPRYWQLHTTSSQAQEGSDFAVVGDDSIAPILQDPQEDWVIAHELAHQWWGGLVACENWNEVWLNEGFAVFMTAAWKEHRWGRAAYDREMALARRRHAASTAAGFDRPLAWDGAYPSLGVRRGIVYSKAALFLDALRTRLGDDAFWRAIRLYTRRHAGGVATSADFRAAVETVAPGRAGDLFETWVTSSMTSRS